MKTTMRFLLIIMVMAGAMELAAQTDSTAPYWKSKLMPKIDIQKTDSGFLTNQTIKKGQNTMLMFFSPTCDHCRHQTADLLIDIDKFKGIQIIMASYQPMEEIVKFYKEFELSLYPNITVGRDRQFIWPPFYKMKSLPYLALYDKSGKLLTSFEGNRRVEVILDGFSPKR